MRTIGELLVALLTGQGASRRCWLGLLVLGVPLASSPAQAQSYTVLYTFKCGPNDGDGPLSSLALDSSGNLYGSTAAGGLYGFGTVFELSANGTEIVLHNFAGPPTDGAGPAYSGIARDSAGNLYGTTPNGGTDNWGTVFKVTSAGSETVLVNFDFKTTFSVEPYAGLILDTAGDLYGTTFGYGRADNGSVFEVSPSGQFTSLYLFQEGLYGKRPWGNLVQDSAGNLYGTTSEGGSREGGTVFEVYPTGGEIALHSFTGGDGKEPYDGLARDKSGNLYGTTFSGGISGAGTVFRVSATGVFRVVHRFTGSPDGASPTAGVTLTSGDVYGVTVYGGTGSCNDGVGVGCGAIFGITPRGKESVLYSFTGTPDGEYPETAMVPDTAGNLYGTTTLGGPYGCGTVFKYTP